MRRVGILVAGLALVVGIILGGIVANPFGRSASASTAAVGGRLISLGTIAVPPVTTGEYSMVDVRDCAHLYAMFRASDELGNGVFQTPGDYAASPDGSTRVGLVAVSGHLRRTFDGVSMTSAWVSILAPYVQPAVRNAHDTITTNATGWLWCATSPSYAVGGFAELPALAGTGGSGMGGATCAVLAGAAAGVLAFAVVVTLSVRRWRVR